MGRLSGAFPKPKRAPRWPRGSSTPWGGRMPAPPPALEEPRSGASERRAAPPRGRKKQVCEARRRLGGRPAKPGKERRPTAPTPPRQRTITLSPEERAVRKRSARLSPGRDENCRSYLVLSKSRSELRKCTGRTLRCLRFGCQGGADNGDNSTQRCCPRGERPFLE